MKTRDKDKTDKWFASFYLKGDLIMAEKDFKINLKKNKRNFV